MTVFSDLHSLLRFCCCGCRCYCCYCGLWWDVCLFVCWDATQDLIPAKYYSLSQSSSPNSHFCPWTFLLPWACSDWVDIERSCVGFLTSHLVLRDNLSYTPVGFLSSFPSWWIYCPIASNLILSLDAPKVINISTVDPFPFLHLLSGKEDSSPQLIPSICPSASYLTHIWAIFLCLVL